MIYNETDLVRFFELGLISVTHKGINLLALESPGSWVHRTQRRFGWCPFSFVKQKATHPRGKVGDLSPVGIDKRRLLAVDPWRLNPCGFDDLGLSRRVSHGQSPETAGLPGLEPQFHDTKKPQLLNAQSVVWGLINVPFGPPKTGKPFPCG